MIWEAHKKLQNKIEEKQTSNILILALAKIRKIYGYTNRIIDIISITEF